MIKIFGYTIIKTSRFEKLESLLISFVTKHNKVILENYELRKAINYIHNVKINSIYGQKAKRK